jgi:hypothetical protein
MILGYDSLMMDRGVWWFLFLGILHVVWFGWLDFQENEYICYM